VQVPAGQVSQFEIVEQGPLAMSQVPVAGFGYCPTWSHLTQAPEMSL